MTFKNNVKRNFQITYRRKWKDVCPFYLICTWTFKPWTRPLVLKVEEMQLEFGAVGPCPLLTQISCADTLQYLEAPPSHSKLKMFWILLYLGGIFWLFLTAFSVVILAVPEQKWAECFLGWAETCKAKWVNGFCLVYVWNKKCQAVNCKT